MFYAPFSINLCGELCIYSLYLKLPFILTLIKFKLYKKMRDKGIVLIKFQQHYNPL
jgi:hypothetical protein